MFCLTNLQIRGGTPVLIFLSQKLEFIIPPPLLPANLLFIDPWALEDKQTLFDVFHTKYLEKSLQNPNIHPKIKLRPICRHKSGIHLFKHFNQQPDEQILL